LRRYSPETTCAMENAQAGKQGEPESRASRKAGRAGRPGEPEGRASRRAGRGGAEGRASHDRQPPYPSYRRKSVALS
jgi:hypothetical protein